MAVQNREDVLAAAVWDSDRDQHVRKREHEMGMEINRLHSDTALAITARIMVGVILVAFMVCTAWLIGKFF